MTAEPLNHEDYMQDSESSQPLLEMFRNCMDEEQFLQLIDQTISTKLSFGMKKVCELMVKKINVLLEQQHQELTTALKCKYEESHVRIIVNEEVNMRLKEISDSIELKRMGRINELKGKNSNNESQSSLKKGNNKLHCRKLSMTSVKSAKMTTTEDSQRSPFTHKSSNKSILKSEKIGTPKSNDSLTHEQIQNQGENYSPRTRTRGKGSNVDGSKVHSDKVEQSCKFLSPEVRQKNGDDHNVVSEGKAPKPTTETRGSSKSKRSEKETKKPERMTFGPQANAGTKQDTPRVVEKDDHEPFQFK